MHTGEFRDSTEELMAFGDRIGHLGEICIVAVARARINDPEVAELLRDLQGHLGFLQRELYANGARIKAVRAVTSQPEAAT